MTIARRLTLAAASAGLTAVLAAPALAQWEHRYPKLEDYGHQVYLEQHELPVFAGGPTDPAPAPDGDLLAFAREGWIWLMDLETGRAERLTDSARMDSRPRWSPDGSQIAFVRDSGTDTAVVVLDLETGRETVIDSPAIDLDPEFTADGASIYYSSGVDGSLNLYRRHLETGVEARFTELRQVVRNPRRAPGGDALVYQHGAGASKTLRLRDFLSGEDVVIHRGGLSYRLTADIHPVERLMVFAAPIDNAYHLWTVDLDDPDVVNRITNADPYALMPAFSADGDHVYFVEADAQRRFQIRRMPTHGGPAQTLSVSAWDYGAPTGRLTVSLSDADGAPVTARVAVRDGEGRPVADPDGATQFDPQTGRHYFYVEGRTEITVPAGRYTVEAARGPMTPVQTQSVRVRGGGEGAIALTLAPLWDARAAGYASADHHVHLNGDGHHRAGHGDALRAAAGEALDLLAPMAWNQWERRIDEPLAGVTTAREGVIIAQAQEVRSHFHGHVGLIGQEGAAPFAPWFWGPSNPVLGDPDLTNGLVFDYADQIGAFVTYVHPLASDADPFTEGSVGSIPLELVADGVLEDRMGLELVCAWTSPLGATALWYRFLNIGRPVAAMSGTDSWVDFHRTPAVGTARTYVRLDGEPVSAAAIREAAASGRSFVTTGPALEFSIGPDIRAGEIAPSGPAAFRLTLTSTMAVDRVELVVNGVVVETLAGVEAGESRIHEGELVLPEGGWAAARAYASERQAEAWPTMHARPFAHTSPIWIGETGSTEPGARAAAAADLIRAVEASRTRAQIAYGEREMSRMGARFEAALQRLDALAGAAAQ